MLADYVPTAVIGQVLTETGRLQRRLRRLLARVTELFILALTLFTAMPQGVAGGRP